MFVQVVSWACFIYFFFVRMPVIAAFQTFLQYIYIYLNIFENCSKFSRKRNPAVSNCFLVRASSKIRTVSLIDRCAVRYR